jgi:hypothetical protein
MTRRLLVAAALVALALGGWFARDPLRHAVRSARENVHALRHETGPREVLTVGAPLPALVGAGAWVNGGPVAPDSLGRRMTVVVVFSDTRPATYDLLPRLEELHEGFARAGLRVVGVHVPEYAFAADTGATARLARRLGVRFPIVLDATRELEHALGGIGRSGNPRTIVADGTGRVVGVSTEATALGVRAAIARLMPGVPIDTRRSIDPLATGAAGEDAEPLDIALGVGRVVQGPLAHAEAGEARTFTAQFRYQEQGEAGVPYPVGRWMPEAEGVVAIRGGAAEFVSIRYDAARSGPARVGVVASPPRDGPARLWVLRDEKWLPREALGPDARLAPDGACYIEVTEPRLYRVARGGGVYKLSPERPGLVIHAITLEPRAPAE